jgi:hypothetical protein
MDAFTSPPRATPRELFQRRTAIEGRQVYDLDVPPAIDRWVDAELSAFPAHERVLRTYAETLHVQRTVENAFKELRTSIGRLSRREVDARGSGIVEHALRGSCADKVLRVRRVTHAGSWGGTSKLRAVNLAAWQAWCRDGWSQWVMRSEPGWAYVPTSVELPERVERADGVVMLGGEIDRFVRLEQMYGRARYREMIGASQRARDRLLALVDDPAGPIRECPEQEARYWFECGAVLHVQPRRVFDTARFVRERPDLAQRYLTPPRPSEVYVVEIAAPSDDMPFEGD